MSLGLMLGAKITAAADTTQSADSIRAQLPVEWRISDDRVISVCLTSDKTIYSTNEYSIFRCAISNNTDKSITVLRPFGDAFYAESAGFNIMGPAGKISYSGPFKSYGLSTTQFIELPPHAVAEDQGGPSFDHFPELRTPGNYEISYTYMSSGYPRELPPENYWRGQVHTGSINILIK